MFDHQFKSKIVRIVTNEFSVPADDGIDRAKLFRPGCQFVQKRDHIFFIGNRYIDPGEIAVFQKRFDFFRFFFEEFIGIIAEVAVNLRGVAVAQLSAQKSAFHHSTSR